MKLFFQFSPANINFFAGEDFSAEDCRRIPRTTCDNCLSRGKYAAKDLTSDAQVAVRLVNDFGRGKNGFTLIHCCDVLRGTDSKKVAGSGHNRNAAFGRMKGYKRIVIERLMRRLVSDNVLRETITVGFHGLVISYVQLGKYAQDVLSGRRKIIMDVEVPKKKETVATESMSSVQVDKIVRACYEALLDERKKIAAEKKVAVHNILSNDTLHEMSEVRPHSPEQLLNITGFTQLKIDFYGADFLKRLRNFPPGKPRASDFVEPTTSSSSNWINTNNAAPSNISRSGRGRARKPRKAAGTGTASSSNIDYSSFRYKSSNAAASNSGSGMGRGTPSNSNLNQNIGLMPLPQPKKPKANSMHRRL